MEENLPKSEVRHTKSKTPTVLAALLALVAILAGYFGFMNLSQVQVNNELQRTADQQEAQIEKLQSQLSEREEATDDSEPASNESNAIIDAALAGAAAVEGRDSGPLEATIAKQAGDFARVDIATSDVSIGGYAMILKLSNNQWVEVASGQQGPTQEEIDRYGIPTEIIES